MDLSIYADSYKKNWQYAKYLATSRK